MTRTRQWLEDVKRSWTPPVHPLGRYLAHALFAATFLLALPVVAAWKGWRDA